MKVHSVALPPLILALSLILLLESPARLSHYVRTASTIIVCRVERNNGDGSVTVKVNEVLKGSAPGSVVVRGETGFCFRRGQAADFMLEGKEYLVFLFEGNRVGRLGGIIEIEGGRTLLIQFTEGFRYASLDKERSAYLLTLREAKRQINELMRSASPKVRRA